MKPPKLVMKAVTKHTMPNPTTRVGTIREAIAFSRPRDEIEGDYTILTPEGSAKALEHQVGLQPSGRYHGRLGTETVDHSQELH